MPDGSIRLPVEEPAVPTLTGRQLRLFVRTLRDGWRLLAGGLIVGVLAGVLAVRLVPAHHTVSMVIGPTARQGAAAMGARLPVLNGHETPLAAAEPGPGDEILSDFGRYLQLFTSVPVAERLMARPEVVQAVFPDRWDPEQGRWREPRSLGPWLKRLFLGAVGRDDWVEPDAERVARALQDRVVIETIRTGPMRRISLRHTDRDAGLRLLRALAEATDAHMRAEARRRSAAQIAHVRDRLVGITVAEHRRALADLLSEQERVAMMIEVDLPLAADTIEPPFAGLRPDWPNPLQVVPLAAVLGFAAAGMLVNLRAIWRDGAVGEAR